MEKKMHLQQSPGGDHGEVDLSITNVRKVNPDSQLQITQELDEPIDTIKNF